MSQPCSCSSGAVLGFGAFAAAVVSVSAAVLLGFFLQASGRTAAGIVLTTAVLAGGWALWPQSRPESDSVQPIERVVLIGVDGLSWNVLNPLLAEGRLPNIERLIAEGAAGPLRATLPIRSPIIWTSIATGRRARGHSIRHFTSRSPETGETLPISVGDRTAAALWDICSLSERTVGVVNWLGVWPAENVRGTFASNRLGFRGLPGRVYPPDRLAELEPLTSNSVELITVDASRVALHILKTDRPNLVMVYFSDLDYLQHRYWTDFEPMKKDLLTRLLYPEETQTERTEGRDPIAAELARGDRFVSAVLDQSDAGTAVVLVSDHGFGAARGHRSFRTDTLLNRLHWRFTGPQEQEMDWTRTLVYDASPDLIPRGLPRRFALNERPAGPFGPGGAGSSPARFWVEAEARLASLKTSSGRPVMTKTRRTRNPGSGKEELLVWLDLGLPPEDSVEFADGRVSIKELLGIRRNTGMHRLDGVIIAWGPAIMPGWRIVDTSVLDVTPTVIRWLGLPAAREMQGRSLEGILSPTYRRALPRHARVPTYGGPRGAESRRPERSEADEKMLEKLRSLGYIR